MSQSATIISLSVSTLLSIAGTAVLAIFLLGTLNYYAFIRKSRIVLNFLLLQVSLFMFVGGFAAYTLSATQGGVDFFNRLCYTGVTALPFFFMLFIRDIVGDLRVGIIWIYGIFCSALIAALWIDRTYLITGILVDLPVKGYYSIEHGPLFQTHILLVFAAILIPYFRLIVFFRRNRERQKMLIPLVAGFSLWLLSGIFDGFVSAGIFADLPPIPWVGPVMLVLMISAYLGMLYDEQYRQLRKALDEKYILQEQLLQSQKMEAIGTLAGGLAHDFNNVLGAIMGSANLLELGLKDPNPNPNPNPKREEELLAYIETINSSSRRAADMIRQLLGFARHQELKIAPVDLNQSLENVMIICRNTFPKSIQLDFRYSGEPRIINADATQLEQSLLNLCVNACHAMTFMRGDTAKEGGRLLVAIKECHADGPFCLAHPEAQMGEDYYSIMTSDNGIGMDAYTKSRIFEPFFTTKEKEKGTGLGLAMVYNIIKQHRGFLDVISETGSGTTMIIYLLKPADAVVPRGDDHAGVTVVSGRGTVLIIDDEKGIRTVAAGMLGKAGYNVLVAENGPEGIRLYREKQEIIDVVLLDMSMPAMSGLEVFEKLKEINGRVRVLITSGYTPDIKIKKAIDQGVMGFLQKPFSARMLTEKIGGMAAPRD